MIQKEAFADLLTPDHRRPLPVEQCFRRRPVERIGTERGEKRLDLGPKRLAVASEVPRLARETFGKGAAALIGECSHKGLADDATGGAEIVAMIGPAPGPPADDHTGDQQVERD